MNEGFPAVLGNLWLGAEEAQAVASALLPKLEKTRKEVEELLFEVVTLEVGACVGGRKWTAGWMAGPKRLRGLLQASVA